MTRHFDEHTIARQILAPDADPAAARELAAHLEVCIGCREIYDELKQFYGTVHDDRPLLPEHLGSTTGEMVRSWEGNRVPAPLDQGRRKGITRLWQGIRRRPVATMGAGITALGLALLWFLKTPAPVEGNPVRVVMNDRERALEVFDGSSRRIWRVPLTNGLPFGVMEWEYHTAYSLLIDLDQDGVDEVATILPLEGTPLEDEWATLRIFRADGSLHLKRPLGERGSFRGKEFEATYIPRTMVAIERSGGEGELLVAIHNRHSPSAVLRLSKKGDILGEYWHYGHVTSLRLDTLKGDLEPKLFVCSLNDMERAGSLIILDPRKIEGKGESSVTRGFGHPVSAAELAYIRFPVTPFDSDTSRAYPAYVLDGEDFITVVFIAQEVILFEYVLTKQLGVRSIVPADGAHARFARLREKGTTPFLTLDAMFSDIVQSVRYWNGHSWSATPCRIDPRSRE